MENVHYLLTSPKGIDLDTVILSIAEIEVVTEESAGTVRELLSQVILRYKEAKELDTSEIKPYYIELTNPYTEFKEKLKKVDELTKSLKSKLLAFEESKKAKALEEARKGTPVLMESKQETKTHKFYTSYKVNYTVDDVSLLPNKYKKQIWVANDEAIREDIKSGKLDEVSAILGLHITKVPVCNARNK